MPQHAYRRHQWFQIGQDVRKAQWHKHSGKKSKVCAVSGKTATARSTHLTKTIFRTKTETFQGMQTKVNRNRKWHRDIGLSKMRFTVIRNESVLNLETKAVANLGHVTQEKAQKLVTNHSEEKSFSFIYLRNLCSKGQGLRPLSLTRQVSLQNVESTQKQQHSILTFHSNKCTILLSLKVFTTDRGFRLTLRVYHWLSSNFKYQLERCPRVKNLRHMVHIFRDSLWKFSLVGNDKSQATTWISCVTNSFVCLFFSFLGEGAGGVKVLTSHTWK